MAMGNGARDDLRGAWLLLGLFNTVDIATCELQESMHQNCRIGQFQEYLVYSLTIKAVATGAPARSKRVIARFWEFKGRVNILGRGIELCD